MDFDGGSKGVGAAGERPYTLSYAEEHKARRKRLGFEGGPPTVKPADPAPLDALKQKVAEQEATIAALCEEIVASRTKTRSGHAIACAVAKAHGITFRELISHRRTRHLVHARQHAMWEMKENTSLSLPGIAKILGHRDHTTVLYGIRAHAARMGK